MHGLTALLLTAIASEHLKKQNVNRNIKVSVMKTALIILEEIPENTGLYLVEADEDIIEILKTAHGHYVNGCNNTPEQDRAVDIVNLMLGPRTDDNLAWASESNIPHEYVGMYYQCNVDADVPLIPEKQIDLVVRTGFFL
ncbi:TPA: hypothetical protein OUI25_000440 [Klebsiella pneumoniae]|jgi:hypothetical protein|nr:hypothetical protein [Klebsiella pneumoniae]